MHDVVTRWNSSYYMVDQELQQPICAALQQLKRGELMLPICIVKPLVQITEALGGENGLQLQFYELCYTHYLILT